MPNDNRLRLIDIIPGKNKYKGINYLLKKDFDINNDNLLVCFHGSIVNNKKWGKSFTPLPVFRGYDYEINNCDLLSISDGLLEKYYSDNLELSWFLNTTKTNYLPIYIEIIQILINTYKYKNVYFFGTSGGGYISILLSSYFKENCIISNSQIYLNKHNQYTHFKEIMNKYNDSYNIDIEQYIKEHGPPKHIYNYCNKLDYCIECGFTYDNHHKPFSEFIVNKFTNKIITSKFFEYKDGIKKPHSIQFPNNESTINILTSIIENNNPLYASNITNTISESEVQFNCICNDIELDINIKGKYPGKIFNERNIFNEIIVKDDISIYFYTTNDLLKKWDIIESFKANIIFTISNHTYLVSLFNDKKEHYLCLLDSNLKIISNTRIGNTKWHSQTAIDQNNETIMYAEYPYNGAHFNKKDIFDPIVWRSKNYGLTWQNVFQIKYPIIKHFHTLIYVKSNDTWILTSGDSEIQCKWFASIDNGENFIEITDKSVTNQSIHRTTCFISDDNYYYYATDDILNGTPSDSNLVTTMNYLSKSKNRTCSKLARYNKLTNRVEELCDLGIHIRSMIDVNKGFILISEGQYPSYNNQVFYLNKSNMQVFYLFDVAGRRSNGGTCSRNSKFDNGNFYTYFGYKNLFNLPYMCFEWNIKFKEKINKQEIYNLSDYLHLNEVFWYIKNGNGDNIQNIIFYQNNSVQIDFSNNGGDLNEVPIYLINNNENLDKVSNKKFYDISKMKKFQITFNVINENYNNIDFYEVQFNKDMQEKVKRIHAVKENKNSIEIIPEYTYIKFYFKFDKIRPNSKINIENFSFQNNKRLDTEKICNVCETKNMFSQNMTNSPYEFKCVKCCSGARDRTFKILLQQLVKDKGEAVMCSGVRAQIDIAENNLLSIKKKHNFL